MSPATAHAAARNRRVASVALPRPLAAGSGFVPHEVVAQLGRHRRGNPEAGGPLFISTVHPESAEERSGFTAELADVAGTEVVVVHGHGELDLANRHELRAATSDVLARRQGPAGPADHPVLVIDLSRATYLGATIVAAMIEEVERTRPGNVARLVVARTGIVSRVAAILHLGTVFDVFDDVDAALRSASAGPRGREPGCARGPCWRS